jgi:ESS family glutamate:Na+ symporter
MNYSAENTVLWNFIIQMGFICGVLVIGNVLRLKLPFIKKTMMPTSVLSGFILLFLRIADILPIDINFLEMVTYHGIGLGFIAMSLRIPEKSSLKNQDFLALKNGALIVSTYLVQGIVGLIISLGFAYTVFPSFFKASGILLPMGYGQGPGQASNIGATYENLGFVGGRSYGLAIAASGYLCACIVGVIYLNYLAKKKRIVRENHDDISGSVTVEIFQDKGEMPISESMDKFSMQVALVIIVYALTFGITKIATFLLDKYAPGVSSLLSPVLWGFNFITGSVIAVAFRGLFSRLRRLNVMKKQYQNNYLLSRISGLCFDIMIVGGIASIDFNDISGLWGPFIVTILAGAVVTFIYIKWVTDRIYKGYEVEGFLSMFGMLTGTISSGILLLREVDPLFKTPAGNNLITGSSTAIVLALPLLVLIGLAPKSDVWTWLVLVLITVYLGFLLLLLFKLKKRQKSENLNQD